MSVAIATFGMFTPATGSGTTIIQGGDTGSSGYGYGDHKPKPVIIIQSVEKNDKNKRKPNVVVREVEEL